MSFIIKTVKNIEEQHGDNTQKMIQCKKYGQIIRLLFPQKNPQKNANNNNGKKDPKPVKIHNALQLQRRKEIASNSHEPQARGRKKDRKKPNRKKTRKSKS